jgi:hypothetical protein
MFYDGAFAPLDCNLRFFFITVDFGFLQVRRYLLYLIILVGYSLMHRIQTKHGTWAKKLTNWQFIPSTTENIRRINLGHQGNHT